MLTYKELEEKQARDALHELAAQADAAAHISPASTCEDFRETLLAGLGRFYPVARDDRARDIRIALHALEQRLEQLAKLDDQRSNNPLWQRANARRGDDR